ncbi:MAG: hypothetical protein QXF40_02110 [Metallosphaera sp.]
MKTKTIIVRHVPESDWKMYRAFQRQFFMLFPEFKGTGFRNGFMFMVRTFHSMPLLLYYGQIKHALEERGLSYSMDLFIADLLNEVNLPAIAQRIILRRLSLAQEKFDD